jgi:hypothetical protein
MSAYSRTADGLPELSVTPKRILAERVLRFVEARSGVPVSRQSRVLRHLPCLVGSRSVPTPSLVCPSLVRPCLLRTSLPRLVASSSEDPRHVLSQAFRRLRQTAQVNKLQRLAGQFAEPNFRPGSSPSKLRKLRSVASRLN